MPLPRRVPYACTPLLPAEECLQQGYHIAAWWRTTRGAPDLADRPSNSEKLSEDFSLFDADEFD
jgi:hypothetical protein